LRAGKMRHISRMKNFVFPLIASVLFAMPALARDHHDWHHDHDWHDHHRDRVVVVGGVTSFGYYGSPYYDPWYSEPYYPAYYDYAPPAPRVYTAHRYYSLTMDV